MALRSRLLRIFVAAAFVFAILSPAAVVFAVVWTAPPVTAPPAPPQIAPQPARLLPAPDVQSTSLPSAPPNVYANTMSGTVPCPLCELPPRVYVPNSTANTVDVIDPLTFKVIDHYSVGAIPHHIAPAWDMSALYVDDEGASKLTVLDIHTGRPTGQTISIPFPYNLYFSPDGTKAIDVVERLQRIEFRDPHNGWKLLKSVGIPWPGADHLDFSADGSYLMISTEYSGVVAKVDVNTMSLAGSVRVGGLPIDVRLSPDGSVFYVTNQGRMGVSVIDPVAMKEIQFIPTGRGAHGLQVSRDTRSLYVSNRLEGSVSVIDFATRRVVAKWFIPGGGSPDMLQLSPDGTQLWASGRYNATVYVFSTITGQVLARIRVGSEDHGLTYFPNVGLHSLGHNGVYR
ncbi:MAG TPA: YncE family protein [Candidatus Sulfotelmatobacter sp.]|nr:YncE family protein [Candidatus Sulfotelmatobacter sp.]